MKPHPWLMLVLAGALVGLTFAGFSTYDFVQHLDRQVHSVHCSFIPGLGKDAGPGVIAQARAMGVKLPPALDDPNVELTGELVIEVLRDVSWHFFPGLAPAGETSSH